MTISTLATLGALAVSACATVDDELATQDSTSGRSYSTSFDATENPISESGAWSNLSGDWAKVRTTGGMAIGTQTGSNGYDDSYARLSGFPADHTVSGVIHLNPSLDRSCSREVELLLRVTDAPHSFKAYEVLLNFEGQIQAIKLNGPMGDYTVLPGGDRYYGLKTGDVFSASISGNTITAFINNTKVLETSDPGNGPTPRHTSGNPGIGFFKRECGSNSDFGFTSFSATSPGAAAPPPAPSPTPTPAPTNAPPSVTLTRPAAATTLVAPATVELEASASDDGGVARVEFFAGNTRLATDTTAPYAFTWTGAPAGTYSLTARATDNQNVTRTSAAVTLTVTTPAPSPPPTGGPRSYSTSFDATENPISEGGAWSNLSGDWAKVRTTGGMAIGTQTGSNGYDDSYARLSGFPADHRVSGVIHLNPSLDRSCSREVELLLRVTDAPRSFKAYEVLLNFEGQIQAIKLNGPMGDYTVLPGGDRYYGLKTGDVFSASITGNTITAFINNTKVLETADPGNGPTPRYTSGNPGIGFFKRECGSNSDFGFTSFTATSL